MRIAKAAWCCVPLLIFGLCGYQPVEGASKEGTAGKSGPPRIAKRDATRDAKTPAKPLKRNTVVTRYTNRELAAKERREGIPPGKHMTAPAGPGRPLGPKEAQRRYGLAKAPDAREMIELPKGQSVRRNKVIGGKPGEGEITSPGRVPPGAIKRVTPLR